MFSIVHYVNEYRTLICGMLIICSGDILGLMSGGSSDDVILESDDVILESPAWTMTCCDPVLLDLSSVSPEGEELP